MTQIANRAAPRLARSRSRRLRAAACAATVIGGFALPARADEGGVSFWLPGMFGSFAAAPGNPGWSGSVVYYHTSVSAGGGKTFQDGANFVAGLKGQGDLALYGVTYTFAQPVAGGQFALSMFNVAGRNAAEVDATLTGPLGRQISGSRSQSLVAFGDLIPQATLKWNSGVNNFLVYGTGDIPVGDYDSNRLANLGLGHGAIDGGAGYTYLNPANGWEFSATAGLTYNFENPSTQYQNGVDGHFDWGLSRFLTKQFDIGVNGYVFQQITDDSGPGAKLGGFRSRVVGVGPEVNYLFPVGDKVSGAASLKIYKEFEAQNRPEGWNAWLSLSFSEAPHKAAEPIAVKY